MLIGIALDATCLSPECVRTHEECVGAERILEAVTENAVLVASSAEHFIGEFLGAVMRLDTQTGQRIQLAAVEIAKNRDRFIATPRGRSLPANGSPIEQLRQTAMEMHADIVVTRDSNDAAGLADLRSRGIEVCTVPEYRNSKAEARRKIWLSGQRLDKLTDAESSELLGRSIMYAEEIMILDKMIAPKGKDGYATAQLSQFARGILHVAQQWRIRSPSSSHISPSLVIISSAGQCGARAGFVDPQKAEKAIRTALASIDSAQLITNVTVDLRQDSNPAVFNDRFIAGLGRCWSISHGLDDIGRLLQPRAKRRPTILAPDCQAYRDIVADIKLLRRA